MARITVEDCLDNVENRFELVLLAAKRARQLESGEAEPTVDWENDKSTVVALREIANGTFSGEEVVEQQNIEENHEFRVAMEPEDAVEVSETQEVPEAEATQEVQESGEPEVSVETAQAEAVDTTSEDPDSGENKSDEENQQGTV